MQTNAEKYQLISNVDNDNDDNDKSDDNTNKCREIQRIEWKMKGNINRFVMLTMLGKPSSTNSAVCLNIVQTAFDPPPPRFEHVCCKFFWTTSKKVCKRLSRQNDAQICGKMSNLP